jgi:hypothetical protein
MDRSYSWTCEEGSGSSPGRVKPTNWLDIQEIFATGPEHYREYLKESERRGKEVMPNDLTDEEKIAQMEVNMKALTDYDPDLIPGFDIERVRKSMAFMNKVKVGHAMYDCDDLLINWQDRYEVPKPETYQQFLAVWKSEEVPQEPVGGVWERIQKQIEPILADEPDLLKEFDSLVLPDKKAEEIKQTR